MMKSASQIDGEHHQPQQPSGTATSPPTTVPSNQIPNQQVNESIYLTVFIPEIQKEVRKIY